RGGVEHVAGLILGHAEAAAVAGPREIRQGRGGVCPQTLTALAIVDGDDEVMWSDDPPTLRLVEALVVCRLLGDGDEAAGRIRLGALHLGCTQREIGMGEADVGEPLAAAGLAGPSALRPGRALGVSHLARL